MGGSVNDAMVGRACALLYSEPDGLEWEPIIEAMTITGDEKRAGRVLQDLVEVGDVERRLGDGEAFRYYLSPVEREARDAEEISMRVSGLMRADEKDEL